MTGREVTEEVERWLRYSREDLETAEIMLSGDVHLLPADWRVKTEYPDLAELTEWAVESRYPGDWPDPTRDDATRAVAEARGIFDVIESDLERAL